MAVALVKTQPSFNAGDETTFNARDETPEKAGGRPRKYATRAERDVAYRARNTLAEIRLEPATLAQITGIAAGADISRNELISQMLKFALCNRDWAAQPMFARPLPNANARKKPG
jgi:hypothetical protein